MITLPDNRRVFLTEKQARSLAAMLLCASDSTAAALTDTVTSIANVFAKTDRFLCGSELEDELD